MAQIKGVVPPGALVKLKGERGRWKVYRVGLSAGRPVYDVQHVPPCPKDRTCFRTVARESMIVLRAGRARR